MAHFGAMTDEVKDTRKCPGQGRRELFFWSARRLLAQTATWLEEAVNPLSLFCWRGKSPRFPLSFLLGYGVVDGSGRGESRHAH